VYSSPISSILFELFSPVMSRDTEQPPHIPSAFKNGGPFTNPSLWTLLVKTALFAEVWTLPRSFSTGRFALPRLILYAYGNEFLLTGKWSANIVVPDQFQILVLHVMMQARLKHRQYISRCSLSAACFSLPFTILLIAEASCP